MADEARVSCQLSIQKRSGTLLILDYSSRGGTFQADVVGELGPTPGAFRVPVDGVDIDLTDLTTPGLCFMRNLDDTNTVELGVFNTDQNEFYPLLAFLPCEGYVVRLNPNINREYASTGTGTTSEVNTFRLKAENAPCNFLVEAFDS